MTSKSTNRFSEEEKESERQIMPDAALLHTLATHPERLLAPGKSLRSALIGQGAATILDLPEEKRKRLEVKAYKMLELAYWDKAVKALGDPLPSVHIPRLQLLYKDLFDKAKYVLPKKHPCRIMLENPIVPTTGALQLAQWQLGQLIDALMARCAPVRDEELLRVKQKIDDNRKEQLPKNITHAIAELIGVVDVMKSDQMNALLNKVSDEKLEVEIIRTARNWERYVIKDLIGMIGLRESWEVWSETHGQRHWVWGLVKALGENIPVSCPLPPNWESSGNALPPAFFFCLYDLLRLQNYLQAIVIVAVLRTLVPLPSKNAVPMSSSIAEVMDSYQDISERTFADRVLSLLTIEVDDISQNRFMPTSTKLINLVDEIEHEHRRLQASGALPPPLPGPTSSDPDLTIQAKVEALLQFTNPVYSLLRRRLLNAIADTMTALLEQYNEHNTFTGRTRIPQSMVTGRGAPHYTNAISSFSKPREVGAFRRFIEDPQPLISKGKEKAHAGFDSAANSSYTQAETRTKIKFDAQGYEDPALMRGVEKAVCDLADVVEWMRDTWVGSGVKGLDNDYDEDTVDDKRRMSNEEEETRRVKARKMEIDDDEIDD